MLETFGTWAVSQFVFLFLCMLAAWWSTPPATDRLRDVRTLLIIGIILRIMLVPLEPYLSNDVDRYLFDGKIALEGYDPYRVNHEAEALRSLRQAWSPPPEHTQYPTLYPPLSLALFSAAASAGVEHATLVWKCLTAVASLATLFLVAILLRERGQLRHLALVALSPVLILESGIGAHVDAFSALFVTAALLAYQRGRLAWAGVYIGLGALVKLLPIALLLPLVLGQRRLHRALRIAAAAVTTVVAGYALTLLLGFLPIGSLGTLFAKWRFGSALFPLLEPTLSSTVQLVLVVTLLGVGGLWIALRSRQGPAPVAIDSPLLPASLCLILLLSPVVFPWYLMVLVPLVAVNPQPFVILWLGTLPLTYEVLGGFYAQGTWEPAQWPLAIMAGGFALGLYLTLRGGDGKGQQYSTGARQCIAE